MDWFRSFFDAEYVSLLRDQWSSRQTRGQVDALWRLLRLRRGSLVLDVACGFGRHAVGMARRGARVVGVDLSRAMLAAASRHRRVAYRRGDMRSLRYRAEFDAATCLFTSFGYFSDADNRRALRGMVAALKPGGRLLIDHRDRRWARAHDAPRLWFRVKDRFVCEEGTYDARAGLQDRRWWIVRPGRRRVATKRFRVRLYDRAQWRSMLAAAGARLLGFPQAGAFARRTGPRLLVLAQRVETARGRR